MRVSGSARALSVEEIHRIMYAAVEQRRPIAAVYEGGWRWLCPHVMGYNRAGQHRVFCYQYGGESKTTPQLPGDGGVWRCLALEKFSWAELLNDRWRTEPHARQRCVENIEVDAEDYPGGDPQNGQ